MKETYKDIDIVELEQEFIEENIEEIANKTMSYFWDKKITLSKSVIFDKEWADQKMQIIDKYIAATEDLIDFLEEYDWY